MRTTIRLPDALLRQAKTRASETGSTLNAVIEDAVRAALLRREPVNRAERLVLPTFRGKGLQPGVDLDDSAALLDLMSGL
jgi:hypothetical protein